MEYKEILLDIIENISDDNFDSIKTGFKDIDNMLSATGKGSLIIIGGRPAMGKTCFMTSILENLLKAGYKCLYFSLEMSKDVLGRRFICQCSEINYQHTVTKDMTKTDWEKVAQFLTKTSEYNFFIDDSSNLTIENLEKEIKKIKPEYVFIDYLQLMSIKSEKTYFEGLTNVLIELKRIAKENNLFIFMASQLSRAVENRKYKYPMLCDLKGPGTIEEFVDAIMLIYRDDYYTPPSEDEGCTINKGQAEIIIAKNKNGPVGIVRLLFKSSIMKFMEPLKIDIF